MGLTKYEKQKKSTRLILLKLTPSELEGDISDTIRYLNEIADEDRYKEYDSLKLEADEEYGYDSCHPMQVLFLVGYKQETDLEYERRIAKLKAAYKKKKDQEKKAELKLLKELKKKYAKEIKEDYGL